MAFPRVCFVVVLLWLASVISCNEIENREYGEGSRNPYIYKREEHQRRLASDRGEVRAVPIFRESSRVVRDLKNIELNCLYIRPNSFMLPHYSTARRLLFVQQGKARVGWVHRGKVREVELERGSVHFIPMGCIFYAINNDRSQTLVIVNLLQNPNPYTQRHHESFYVGGGRNPPTIYSAFRQETLAAAFNTEVQRIERLLSKQNEGAFASLNVGEEKKKLLMSGDINEIHNSPLWKRRSKTSEEEEYKPFNLLKKNPKFSNDNGRYFLADDEDLAKGPIKREEMGISYTRIEPRAMVAPNWQSHSTMIAVIAKGRGRVEIASPEGVQQQRRSEGGGGEEEEEGKREREEGEEGEFRVSYKRVEEEVQEGDVVVIPAGHPSTQIASSNQPLEFLSFHINYNDERNEVNFLAGKNSAVMQLKNELLAASFKESEQEVKKVFESQEEQIFVKGPAEKERGSRAVL